MKKNNSTDSESSAELNSEEVEPSESSKITDPRASKDMPPLNNPASISSVFTIHPEAGTQSLLGHAREILASMNVMSTDLACGLEGSRRATAIQQLASVAELLVDRALKILELPDQPHETSTTSKS